MDPLEIVDPWASQEADILDFMTKPTKRLNFEFLAPVSESELKTNNKGQQFLTVYYDPDLNNFNEMIKHARAKHGIESNVSILAIPKKGGTLEHRKRQPRARHSSSVI